MLSNQYLNESKNQRFLDEIINKETTRFTFGCEYITGEEESYIVYDYNFELEKNNKGDYVIKHESLNLKMVIIPIIIMLMYMSVIMVNLLMLIVMRLLRIL